MQDIEALDDEQLAATAFVNRQKGRQGDQHAKRTAEAMDTELKRRLASTPSQHAPLELPAPKRPWWKLWETKPLSADHPD